MRRKRSRKPAAARIAAVAGAAGLAATAVWRFVQRRRSSGAGAGAGSPAPQEAPSAMREWTCECGQRFRVSGEDRHRVFWVEDASEDDPVLGDECPNCERSLTAQETSAA